MKLAPLLVVLTVLAVSHSKSVPYFGDSITALLEFMAANGSSTGNYFFQYSKTQNIGSFQRNGPYQNTGANTVLVDLRNFGTATDTSLFLNQNGSCTTGSNIFPTWQEDITENLCLLPSSATFVSSAQIGAYWCDGWTYNWACCDEQLTTWVTKDLNGNPVPVRTDFPSTDQDVYLFYSYFDGLSLIDPRVYQVYQNYEPCSQGTTYSKAPHNIMFQDLQRLRKTLK